MKPKNNDYLGFRSQILSDRLRAFKAMNPEVKLSELIRAAVQEKLDRLTQGEDAGIKIVSPETKKDR